MFELQGVFLRFLDGKMKVMETRKKMEALAVRIERNHNIVRAAWKEFAALFSLTSTVTGYQLLQHWKTLNEITERVKMISASGGVEGIVIAAQKFIGIGQQIQIVWNTVTEKVPNMPEYLRAFMKTSTGESSRAVSFPRIEYDESVGQLVSTSKSGGVMASAFNMMTDFVTTPSNSGENTRELLDVLVDQAQRGAVNLGEFLMTVFVMLIILTVIILFFKSVNGYVRGARTRKTAKQLRVRAGGRPSRRVSKRQMVSRRRRAR